MYSQVLNKTCPYARSPPNFPLSEMTAKGAPISSNLLVRTDPSPLAVICPESMPGAKITTEVSDVFVLILGRSIKWNARFTLFSPRRVSMTSPSSRIGQQAV